MTFIVRCACCFDAQWILSMANRRYREAYETGTLLWQNDLSVQQMLSRILEIARDQLPPDSSHLTSGVTSTRITASCLGSIFVASMSFATRGVTSPVIPSTVGPSCDAIGVSCSPSQRTKEFFGKWSSAARLFTQCFSETRQLRAYAKFISRI